MIIWGFDGNYKQLGEGPIGKCENCNNVVVFQVIQQSRRFKLYFVPVLKYNSQYWALCPTCTAGYQLPNKNDALAFSLLAVCLLFDLERSRESAASRHKALTAAVSDFIVMSILLTSG